MTDKTSAAEGSSSGPIGEATSLANQAVSNPQLTPNSAQAATPAQAVVQGNSVGEEPSAAEVRVVQFSILYDGDEEKFEHLWAMRDCMHRALNVAISEWHRAEKVVSSSTSDKPRKKSKGEDPVADPVAVAVKEARKQAYWGPHKTAVVAGLYSAMSKARAEGEDIAGIERDLARAIALKETAERSPVTEAVKRLLASEREYWGKQLPKALAAVEKLRVTLGSAKAKAKSSDDERVKELEIALANAQKNCLKCRVRSAIGVPSSVYDSVVQFTLAKHGQYLEAAFQGDRSLDSFRAGQPIRWRDGSWKIRTGSKKGGYELELELDTDGKRVRREAFQVIPDGPAMHGYAKQMVSGAAKLCDARVVYSEKKKQWFAKLTIRTDSTPNWVRAAKAAPKPWTGTAALRRGIHHAFILVFDDGWMEGISGGDVLHFKRKLKARKESLGKHLDKLELGPAARGRGKRRRFAALRRIDDGEARFVDWRCKTWGVNIAKMCAQRGVGRLLVSSMNLGEFKDGDDHFRALLYQWPFAKMRDQVASACGKIGVEVEEFDSTFNARRCPKCKHIHAVRQLYYTFLCEKCEFKRPADQIVAWNGLVDAVGDRPMEKSEEAQKPIRELEKMRPSSVAPSQPRKRKVG